MILVLEVDSQPKGSGFEPQFDTTFSVLNTFSFLSKCVCSCPLGKMQIRYLTAISFADVLLWPSVHMRQDIHLCHSVRGSILCADEVVKTLF